MSASATIFVNIASYRDTECQWTVRDLFRKAAVPDRVTVGLCWQFVPERDQDCFAVEERPEQVRRVDFHASQSRGVCWARHQVQKLWNGEDFTLQIDSHMRFVPGWDRILLEMYAQCPTDRAVLSTYPVSYTPPDTLSPPAYVTIGPKEFDEHGLLKFKSVARSIVRAPSVPEPTAFVAAGFLFGPGRIVEDVPYDPHIYFHGEEITLAVRLWTHGWDLFTPNKHLIYHDYSKRPEKARHWEDDVDWAVLNRRSLGRVRRLLGGEDPQDPEALIDLDAFGLGEARSLAAYEEFAGVSFRERKVSDVASSKTLASTALGAGNSNDRERIFTAIWEQKTWGNAETVSGDGATLGRTETIRPRLLEMFEKLDIEILGDAGCGDLNWQAEMTGRLRLYLGFDIVEGLVNSLREIHAGRRTHFFSRADIVRDILPRCDAILCRDCLTHLTWAETQEALHRMVDSGSTYLIATTHAGRENKDIRCGGWYPMNLTAAPFRLPEPIHVIEEGLPGSTKALGVWRLADIGS